MTASTQHARKSTTILQRSFREEVGRTHLPVKLTRLLTSSRPPGCILFLQQILVREFHVRAAGSLPATTACNAQQKRRDPVAAAVTASEARAAP